MVVKQNYLVESLQNKLIIKITIIGFCFLDRKTLPWSIIIQQLDLYHLNLVYNAIQQVINNSDIQEELLTDFVNLKKFEYCNANLVPGLLICEPLEHLLLRRVSYLNALIKKLYPPPPPPYRMWRGRRLVLIFFLLKICNFNAWFEYLYYLPIPTIFWCLFDYRTYLEFGILECPLTNRNSFLFWTYVWIYIYTPIEVSWDNWLRGLHFNPANFYYTRWKQIRYL